MKMLITRMLIDFSKTSPFLRNTSSYQSITCRCFWKKKGCEYCTTHI